jgi:hypothetical protein
VRLCILATLLAIATQTVAIADPVAPPIVLNDCRFNAFAPSARVGYLNLSSLRDLWVDFQNTGDAPIAAITFDATKYGEHLVVTDTGHFAKGATVTHQLTGTSTKALGDDRDLDSCKVIAVRFADDSTATYL